MAKFIKTLFALILLFFTISFLSVVILVKFNNTSYEGQKIKSAVLKNPLLVTLINLNEPGDARFSYFSAQKPLTVKLFYTAKTEPNDQIRKWLTDMVMETIGKKIDIELHSANEYPSQDVYSDRDLNLIRDTITHRFNATPIVNIVYLSSHADKSSHAGIVLHRDTLFIFKETLASLTTDGQVLEKLEKSTLMHEWGHLLGLDHIEGDNCIMNEKVEVYDTYFQKEQIPTQYCYEEMTKIAQFKKSVK